MNFIKKMPKKHKKMTILDLACIKLSVAACMLLILKFYPQLLAEVVLVSDCYSNHNDQASHDNLHVKEKAAFSLPSHFQILLSK